MPRLSDLPDDDLLQQFKESGRPEVIDELFRRHGKVVFQVCRAMLPRDRALAEDMTQETFVRAWMGLRSVQPGSLAGWLATIARNRCLDYFRSWQHRLKTLQDEGNSDESDWYDLEEGVISACDVTKILAKMPVEQRICLKLCYAEGYSYKQICERTGWDYAQVRSHIQNGKLRFREMYKEKPYQLGEGDMEQ